MSKQKSIKFTSFDTKLLCHVSWRRLELCAERLSSARRFSLPQSHHKSIRIERLSESPIEQTSRDVLQPVSLSVNEHFAESEEDRLSGFLNENG